MATSTVSAHRAAATRGGTSADEVRLAGDWLDRWLIELDPVELRAYLQLAHYYNSRTYHDAATLSQVLPGLDAEQVLAKLEKRGLIEVVRRDERLHYHFPHRDREGYHRADSARPSLVEALAFQERMSEELLELTEQDESDGLRQRYFERYPQLQEEHELYQRAADPAAPRWRLWMEVSRLLIREFEQTYGSLKEDHGELFKEVSGKVLRHHLDVVDAVVAEVLYRLDELFPQVTDHWVVTPDQDEFVAQPFVRRLAQRFGIGPEQIFLNTIEALSQQGKAVLTVGPAGYLADMILPSDTGLTRSEERVLFLRPEERAQPNSPRNQARVRMARNKYANHLIHKACRSLSDFAALGRVRSEQSWLPRIAELVNDALSLLPTHDGSSPVALEHVMDRWDAVRQEPPTVMATGASHDGDDDKLEAIEEAVLADRKRKTGRIALERVAASISGESAGQNGNGDDAASARAKSKKKKVKGKEKPKQKTEAKAAKKKTAGKKKTAKKKAGAKAETKKPAEKKKKKQAKKKKQK